MFNFFLSKEVFFFKFQEERPRHQWRWSWWTTYSWESEEWWHSSTSFGSMDLWVCVFFVIVFLFATGTSFKSKANTNHRCAPSSPTLTPRLKTNWPLRVQPYGGPYLRLYLFSMYNLFAIDSVWVQPYGWPNYLPFEVFVFFNIFIFIVWTIWGAIPWMLIMWLSLSLRIIVIVFAYVKTFILIMTESLSESIRSNQNKNNWLFLWSL